MATIRVEHSVAIPGQPDRVFRAASDPFRQLEWDQGGMQRVEALTDGELRKGARYRGTFKGMGTVEYEFSEFEPNSRFVHVARIPLGVIRHTFMFSATPEGTRMTQVGELAPNALGRVAAPFMRKRLARRFAEVGNRLRRYLYAGGGHAA